MTGNSVELQRWSCYVDEIDETHVHLVMADMTVDYGDDREIGSFPKELLAHLDPVEGQYVTVRVMSDERIDIRNTEFTEEQMDAGRARRDELLALLERLREDDTLSLLRGEENLTYGPRADPHSNH
jgi:hypothetical protein